MLAVIVVRAAATREVAREDARSAEAGVAAKLHRTAMVAVLFLTLLVPLRPNFLVAPLQATVTAGDAARSDMAISL
jgi:hypothetical protein